MSSNQPTFSVILPTYNHGKFIGKAIQSVLDQTFADFELIIIDNHSTDDTEEIVRSFSENDHRINYFKIHNNGVIAKSRNYGIEKASGEFLSFLDSDDLWFQEKLQKVFQIFQQNNNVEVVYHGVNEIRAKKITTRKSLAVSDDSYKFLVLHGNQLVTSATSIKKNALNGGFPEDQDFISAEDYALWLNVAQRGAVFHYIEAILGAYRCDESSISSSKIYHCENCYNVSRTHLKYLLANGMITKKEYENHLFYQRVRKDFKIIMKLFLGKKFHEALRQLFNFSRTGDINISNILFCWKWLGRNK